MPAPDLTPDIETAAAEPASAASDGQSASARPLGELVEADRYLKGATALAGANRKGGRRSGFNALRTGVFVPRGPL